MQIDIANPVFHTQIFTVLLAVAVFSTLKKRINPFEMDIPATNELKGFAILMVIFSHIGYFLDANDKFLYPLSVAGGVGVNIFLFLSGFGLTYASIKTHHPILKFYLKRLRKIFIPMWLVLTAVLAIDFFVLQKTYPLNTVMGNFLGFFPYADIYTSINSPFWYFSLILYYYIIFPLLFIRKKPVISVFLVFLLSYLILHFNLPENFVVKDVLKLYKLHYLAFPIGMAFAILQNSKFSLTSIIQGVNPYLRFISIILLVLSIGYTAIHSGVGEEVKYEQFISLITMTSFILISLLRKTQSNFIILLGIYSYEIYLIQWPILYRYDFLYKYMPTYLATFIYLGVFLAIAYLMKKILKNKS